MNVFNYVTFVVNVKVILFFVVQQFEFTSRHCTTNFKGGGVSEITQPLKEIFKKVTVPALSNTLKTKFAILRS